MWKCIHTCLGDLDNTTLPDIVTWVLISCGLFSLIVLVIGQLLVRNNTTPTVMIIVTLVSYAWTAGMKEELLHMYNTHKHTQTHVVEGHRPDE